MNVLKSVKVSFNLRTPSVAEKESAVKCIIRWNNKTLTFYSVDNILPKHWDTEKQRAKSSRNFPQYPEFNARLDKIQNQVRDVYRNYLIEFDQYPTQEKLKEIVLQKLSGVEKSDRQLDLFTFIQMFIEEAKDRSNDKTGKPLSTSSIAAYKRTFEILKDFTKYKRKKVFDFDDITLDFYLDFKVYLTNVLKYSNNTVGKHIKTLKTFLNDATERGFNKKLDFKSKRFKVTKEAVDNIYLNEDELKVLYKLDLSKNKRLERIRDLFLVGCWTGLRFSDFNSIKAEDIIEGEYISIEAQKTRQKVLIPLNKIVKDIMSRYKEITLNSMPPSISNVKMNVYLKELGQLAEIDSKETVGRTQGGMEVYQTYKKFQLITTHTARRSFATNMYLRGVPTISIMAITGHRTEKAFMQYIKVTPREHADVLRSYFGLEERMLSQVSV